MAFVLRLFIALIVLGSGLRVFGSTDPAAQQLLISARQKANLFEGQNNPFQLDVDFIAQQRVPSRGHLTLKWKEKDKWWDKVVMGDFEQIEVRNGDKLYTKRNINFTPARIKELTSLLHFGDGSETLLVKKQRERTENGTRLLCLRVDGKVRGKNHEVCLSFVSHDIVSDDWQEPPDQKRTELYKDYVDFGGHRYPRNLELIVNGSKVITATVGELTNAAIDQSLLVAPDGAIERRQCADMKHAIPLNTPEPMYPKSASENGLTGDTTVAMTVLADGSVSDVQLIGTAARSMDEATLRTLKGWKFKPAMCGADPVISDFEVIVSFRLR